MNVNFKLLGPKFGKNMKDVSIVISNLSNLERFYLYKNSNILRGGFNISKSDVVFSDVERLKFGRKSKLEKILK